jgi:hypothetical protein
MRCHSHLMTKENRLGLAKALGHSIGAMIDRSKSTISRELSRNRLSIAQNAAKKKDVFYSDFLEEVSNLTFRQLGPNLRRRHNPDRGHARPRPPSRRCRADHWRELPFKGRAAGRHHGTTKG